MVVSSLGRTSYQSGIFRVVSGACNLAGSRRPSSEQMIADNKSKVPVCQASQAAFQLISTATFPM